MAGHKGVGGASALRNVQKYFPEVTQVEDADKSVILDVTKGDVAKAERRAHKTCAMAVACKRALEADGVIISVKTAYVIKGKKAQRYRLPESVSREIVSYDRDSQFAPGEYHLSKPEPSTRLGAVRKGRPKGKWGNGNGGSTGGSLLPKHVRVHRTTGIRTVLGH